MIGNFPQDRAAEPSWLTVPFSYVYGCGARLHRAWRQYRAFEAAVPVISVGGITAGGSGKTPFTIALCRRLIELEPRLARPNALCVLSRGYGRTSAELSTVQTDSSIDASGDEPLLIKQSLPLAGVIVHADRRVSARVALERLAAKLLIMDDGFQHGLLARDMNLVIVDGKRPLGNGFVLPAGPLREFTSALRCATHLVAVGEVSADTQSLSVRMGVPLTSVTSRMQLSQDLKGLACGAFCGIARPERFFAGLEQAGTHLVFKRGFRDHYVYSSKELTEVQIAAERSGAKLLVTTAKDRVRFSTLPAGMPLAICDVEHEIPEKGGLEADLKLLLGRLVW